MKFYGVYNMVDYYTWLESSVTIITIGAWSPVGWTTGWAVVVLDTSTTIKRVKVGGILTVLDCFVLDCKRTSWYSVLEVASGEYAIFLFVAYHLVPVLTGWNTIIFYRIMKYIHEDKLSSKNNDCVHNHLKHHNKISDNTINNNTDNNYV